MFRVIRWSPALLACAAGLWLHGNNNLSQQADAGLTSEPEQISLNAPRAIITQSGWNLHSLARFTIEARVLGKKRYAGDETADLAPYDLAIGWGRMSDESVLERMDFTQGGRSYAWRYWGRPPIPESEIVTHSANMHIIPADDTVLKTLEALRHGESVRLSGTLVEATHPRAERPWRSSLRRDDTGEGACEIFHVVSISRTRCGP